MSVRAAVVSEGGNQQDLPVDLDALFRAYACDLNSFAFRRLRDREAAADVVQDGFLRFLVWNRSRPQPVGVADARNVLRTVISNLTIDLVRQKKSRGFHDPLDLAGPIADPYPTQDRFLEGREAYRLVKEALDASPPLQRAALLLNRIGGLTHAEIAVKLGLSPQQVSRYIVKVLDRCLVRLAAGPR
ncbi:sigma-70 family RNA polymerase sigma factor [Bradyrhizobium sp. LHD-71]|uniref:RNA polymerase sigma factor n=1 Tax=Bradyrhizobium sp. LHD-71 TaxID=3072141 RepID=UPI00280C855C|nr:sigma-70 family RNA polymerase sigma factor [Bradyrhizobium sp. LHD-71]MDQ8732399.1 sigma-70 family RNA polymerase sigma factor [Bradyrhizobium sp. LHD-71]